jgi:exodeoxyribonuclease V alpha subunit
MVIQVSVEAVTYGGDGSWTITKVSYDQAPPPEASVSSGIFTLVGDMPPVAPGDLLRCIGGFTTHPKFGMQFKARSAVPVMGTRRVDLVQFLSHLPAFSTARAERAIQALGSADAVVDALRNNPSRLAAVIPRLTEKAAEKAAEVFRARSLEADAFVYLSGDLGLGEVTVARALKEWGPRAQHIVEQDPYMLTELQGIGFKRADEVARAKLQVGAADQRRLVAGAQVALRAISYDDGHTRSARYQITHHGRALRETGLTPAQMEEGLAILEKPRRTPVGKKDAAVRVVDAAQDVLAVVGLDEAEQSVAAHIYRLQRSASPQALPVPDFKVWNRPGHGVSPVRLHDGFEPDADQRAVLKQIAAHPVFVLTGGPGTGKTTLLSGVLQMLHDLHISEVVCAAPTGRAARRMEWATGCPATTIHRLLKYHPVHGFRHNNAPPTLHEETGAWLYGGPIQADMVILDESSMLDVTLASALLQALPDGCRLLFVGDADQLPPIGPGQVFIDLMKSGVVPSARLLKIYRQKEDSAIPYAARAVIEGRSPTFDGDIQFIEEEDPDVIASTIAHAAANVLTKRNKARGRRAFLPDEIQVIAPMHRGPLGVSVLNERLQAVLNPDQDRGSLHIGRKYVARVGDRVLQTRNNYDLDVMNGEMGTLRACDFRGIPPHRLDALGVASKTNAGASGTSLTRTERPVAVVDFPGVGAVAYRKGDLDQLVLGYACTVHKFQGSQAPCVVLPVHSSQSFMLTRQLLYTAMTRGAQFVVLIGTRRALHRTIHRNTSRDLARQTGLGTYLGGQHGSTK